MSRYTFHRAHDSRSPFSIIHIQAQYDPHAFILGKVNLHGLAPPPCNTCSRPSTLTTVHPDNPNNNGGRPYYKCAWCPREDRFITWADAKGFSPDNMKCDCGFGSRLDYVGVSHGVEKRGRKFWTCATGACGFFSWGEGNIKTEEGGSDDEDCEEVEVKDEEEDDEGVHSDSESSVAAWRVA